MPRGHEKSNAKKESKMNKLNQISREYEKIQKKSLYHSLRKCCRSCYHGAGLGRTGTGTPLHFKPPPLPRL